MSVRFTNQGGSDRDGNGGLRLHGNQQRSRRKSDMPAAKWLAQDMFLNVSFRKPKCSTPNDLRLFLFAYTQRINMSNQNGIASWLHITDLHIGKVNESQTNALNSLVASVAQETLGRKLDMVIISGDLAYSGKIADYIELERILINPLKELDAFSNSKFISVPGNHDMDCDSSMPITWSTIGPSRQRQFFDSGPSARSIRLSKANSFNEYSAFTKRNGIISVDPTNEVATSIPLNFENGEIQLILIATSFFSDRETKDWQTAPFPVPAIRQFLEPGDNRKIVIGHHPISWFTSESQNHCNTLLDDASAVYLNGHEHTVTINFNSRGLRTLGFGATYQASLDAPQKGAYRNSYAICEFGSHLHVKVVSWDHEHGKWRVENCLPSDFRETSTILHQGYQLPLATTPLVEAKSVYSTLVRGLQQSITLDQCVWLAEESPQRWASLLKSVGYFDDVIETFTMGSQEVRAGFHQFRVKDSRGNHLVHAVSAAGAVITYDQVQHLNTEFDTQDYVGCVIVTLGEVATDASTLIEKLATKKPVTIFWREKLLKELLRKLPENLKIKVTQVDSSGVKQNLVVTDIDIGILRQSRTTSAWFDILKGDASIYEESDPIVVKIRQGFPELSDARYGRDGEDFPNEQEENLDSSFDRLAYLAATYDNFNDVKYAPLAAIGVRFRDASLADIYVNASADANGSTRNEDAVTRAVEEFIDSLRLPPTQRDQLESQLRARISTGDRSAEVGAARQLYQRYNNVIVLGDPGSGKTCFVKNEILAYCRPPQLDSAWYATHLPVYLALAEAARMIDEDADFDLMELCEVVSSKRGISLPKSEILRAISRGQAAFFFDGLDEVGALSKRSKLLSKITELIELQSSQGNRFVIASRPAAVQPLSLPKVMKYLHLKGLTEPEMRLLAGRVLTIRLGEDEQSNDGLSETETQIVDRLIEDTRQSPGIARLARNPLLLTLLVLIYANTGSLSTKRHLIYTQAIKTLVSVRGREVRDNQIPESDLRVRLGAVAVSIFEGSISEIPKRSEVVDSLKTIMNSETEENSIDNFLQGVAEATGLLRVHRDDVNRNDDLITFMHYSFLEYYAAAGLLARDYHAQLDKIAEKSRWKDVVTLLFGILSEQADITPTLKVILSGGGKNQTITKSRLLLALECAAECDVPPSDSQKILADEISTTLSFGLGRISGEFRGEIAQRLAYFVHGGAAARFYSSLSAGLKNENPAISAAFADLISMLPEGASLSTDIHNSFDKFLSREDAVGTVIGMKALERRQDLRPIETPMVLKRSLKGNLVEKHGALDLLRVVPAYFEDCSEIVEGLLDDANDFIAGSAARCILRCDTNLSKSAKTGYQEKVLMKLNLSDQDEYKDYDAFSEITFDKTQIGKMAASSNETEVELALRYAPMIKGDALFVYKMLIHPLRVDCVARHKAAAMDALRIVPRSLALLTFADTDTVCRLSSDKERNVRIAAYRLLGEMPDDEKIQITLLEQLSNLKDAAGRDLERVELAKAISKHSKKDSNLRRKIIDLTTNSLPAQGFGSPENQSTIVSLLQIVESFTGFYDKALAAKLIKYVDDYRTPENLKRHSLRAFGTLSEPTSELIETLIRLLKKNDTTINESLYSTVKSVLIDCKTKLNFVRRIHDKIEPLGVVIHSIWSRELANSFGRVEVSACREISDIVMTMDELCLQYAEFADRARPAEAVA